MLPLNDANSDIFMCFGSLELNSPASHCHIQTMSISIHISMISTASTFSIIFTFYFPGEYISWSCIFPECVPILHFSYTRKASNSNIVMNIKCTWLVNLHILYSYNSCTTQCICTCHSFCMTFYGVSSFLADTNDKIHEEVPCLLPQNEYIMWMQLAYSAQYMLQLQVRLIISSGIALI